MNSTTTNSTIKLSNRKLNITKEIGLRKFQNILEHTKSTASKQNSMTTISQEHQNTGKLGMP